MTVDNDTFTGQSTKDKYNICKQELNQKINEHYSTYGANECLCSLNFSRI